MKMFPIALCAAAAIAGLASAATRPTPLPLRVHVASLPAARPATPQPQARFDRFIVHYKVGAAASRTAGTTASHVGTVLSRAGLTAAGRTVTMRALRRTATGSQVFASSRALDSAEAERFLAQLAADPQVAWAQPDYIKRALDTVPDDARYADLQWDMHHPVGGVGAPRAWDIGSGRDMVVAVIDTGYVPHADLSANLLPGYDFVSWHGQVVDGTPYPDVAGDGDGRDPDARDPGDWTDDSMANWCGISSPSSWHGTHVAGTVAAVANNGIGIAGLAYGAKVQPVRALGHCGGATSDIVDAIVWASGGDVEGVPANPTPADVVNLSLGAPVACVRDPATQAAIDGALARGVSVVVAAGNSAVDASQFSPASCNGVITVGATGVDGARAGYSNFGAAVTLAAPGGGGLGPQNTAYIWSTGNSGTTTPVASPVGDVLLGMVGTSMAAPHVAAAAAMLQAASLAHGHAPLTPTQIRAILRGTTKPFGLAPPANQPLGTGILDVAAAISVAADGFDERDTALPLTNRVATNGIGAQAYEDSVFKLTVGNGVRSLQVRSYGGTGNVALYLARSRMPTTADFDRASNNPGNSESVMLANPVAGTYYVRLRSPTVYRNVSLIAVAQ